MLNGPALLRVILVVIAAAVLTGLVQHYWVFDSGPADAPAAPRPTAQTAPVRRADPEPVKAPPAITPAVPAALASSAAKPAPEPPPAPSSEAPRAAFSPGTPPIPTETQPSPPPQRAAPPSPPVAAQLERGEQEIAAAETADPRAVDLIDLNTGSLSELNGLKGGGAIGRAIVQHRPYTAIDQLLSKRVLSRAIYQRIKDQVTVR